MNQTPRFHDIVFFRELGKSFIKKFTLPTDTTCETTLSITSKKEKSPSISWESLRKFCLKIEISIDTGINQKHSVC